MTLTQTICPNRIARHTINKVRALLRLEFEKSATELKLIPPKKKLLKCKSTVHITKFNVGTLNRISQLPDLTASAAQHNIDIVSLQEHRHHQSGIEIKYHDTSKFSASVCKNFINAGLRGGGMLLNRRAQKSLNSIEKIRPRMMVATLHLTATPSTSNISCSSPTNASDETDLIIFYNELSFLVRSIPKHNVLIIGGDMNAQIGREENNKFCLYNSSNRNWEHLTEISQENGVTCLNTKFQKRVGKTIDLH